MKGVNFILLILLFMEMGCKKKPDTYVFVYVEDVSGNRVQNASVSLRGQPSDSVYANKVTLHNLDGITDNDGKALFKFTEFYQQGPDGFAILSVNVALGTQVGTGLVKLLEAETSEVTVVIQ